MVLRAVRLLQRVDHRLPAVHAAPADLAFGRQPLAIVLGDVAGLAEGLGDQLGVAHGVLRPVGGACRRIDADDAVVADAEVAQALAELAGLPHIGDEFLAVRRPSPWPSRRPPAARPAPRWSRWRARVLRRLVGQPLDLVVGEVDVGVGGGMEDVDAVELHAVRPRPWRSGRSWCRGRWAAPNPGPCRRGPATSHCEAWENCSPAAMCPPMRFHFFQRC